MTGPQIVQETEMQRQRRLPFASADRTHANRHQAADGSDIRKIKGYGEQICAKRAYVEIPPEFDAVDSELLLMCAPSRAFSGPMAPTSGLMGAPVPSAYYNRASKPTSGGMQALG